MLVPRGHNDAVLGGTQASDPGQFILPTGRTERTISSLPRPGPQCAHAVAHTDIWHRQFPAQASIFTYIMPLRSADHVSASCGSRLDWRLGPDHHSRLWQLQLHLYKSSITLLARVACIHWIHPSCLSCFLVQVRQSTASCQGRLQLQSGLRDQAQRKLRFMQMTIRVRCAARRSHSAKYGNIGCVPQLQCAGRS